MSGTNASPSYAGEHVVKTACQLCVCHCGMNVYVKEGRITRVDGMTEHPVNRGVLCFKGRQALDYVYHKDRLQYPMKKDNGGWKRISWVEALDTIAGKLNEIKEKYGAPAFATSAGEIIESRTSTGVDLMMRFTDAYGSPNSYAHHMCGVGSLQAQNLMFGMMSWHAPSVENTRCAVLWGHNPNMAAPPEMQRIAAARKKGAKLIVIDPRRIAAAKEADIHIQPRPGTDCALALGMLNVIISEGLYDRGFVENWTTGFDQLAEHVKDYTPEKVEKITWVPADSIRETARLYAKTKPACIFYGPTLEQTVSGFEAARAMNTLRAICGNLDVPGGEICISLPLVNLMRLPEKWGDLEKPPRADEFPMYSGAWGLFMGCTGIPTSYVETILSEKPYPIKMMVFSGVNPMVTFPNVTRLKQALEKLDFMVVMDLFMTPTAEMADIVLPACTFLERTDELHNTYMLYENTPYGIFASQAIEPLGESWPDWKFWIELARRMGYGEYFPWKSSEEIIDYYLEPSGLTVKQLKESPSGVPFGTIKGLDYFEQHPEELRFPTPSGKVELYCEALKEMGYDPLPVYREPAESPLSNPELSKQYPLILTTGARLLEYSDSRYRNLPKMRRRKPKPVAEIHPASAEKHGINDGEMITVESIRGVLSIKASVTEDIMPGVVRIAGVWPEGTANILTDDAPACPIMGYPELRSVLCRVKSS